LFPRRWWRRGDSNS